MANLFSNQWWPWSNATSDLGLYCLHSSPSHTPPPPHPGVGGDALLMSTHNIRFCGEIRKLSILFGPKEGLIWSYGLAITLFGVSRLKWVKQAGTVYMSGHLFLCPATFATTLAFKSVVFTKFTLSFRTTQLLTIHVLVLKYEQVQFTRC